MLVDTSIWVDHFRHGNAALSGLLEQGVVWSHPFIVGELACGNLRRRAETLDALDGLRLGTVATDQEVRHLVESQRLFGRGLGWIDVHLLASAAISRVPLWTRDRALRRAAEGLGIAAAISSDDADR